MLSAILCIVGMTQMRKAYTAAGVAMSSGDELVPYVKPTQSRHLHRTPLRISFLSPRSDAHAVVTASMGLPTRHFGHGCVVLAWHWPQTNAVLSSRTHGTHCTDNALVLAVMLVSRFCQCVWSWLRPSRIAVTRPLMSFNVR
jgi:hypothetical protein